MALLPPRCSALRRCLAVAVLLSVLATAAAIPGECDDYFPAVKETPALPKTVLDFLNNTQYSLVACRFTFAQHEAAWAPSRSCFHAARAAVHTCPRDCLRAYDDDPEGSRVIGSWPYHANSSICLAAIHAGVIDADRGGGLFVDRFWPEDWSNSSTQSIFPRGSHLSSHSNGVLTEAVPASAAPSPAPLLSYSWTVRTRGVVASQRQVAPFAPRAGHVHAVLPFFPGGDWQPQRMWPHYLHLIIGGLDPSIGRYYNDAWLYYAAPLLREPSMQAAINGRWFRIDPAPFTGRAYMLHHLLEDGQWDRWRDQWRNQSAGQGMPGVGGKQAARLLIIGGQTAHHCNQPVLGQCENDVWALTVAEDAAQTSTGGLRVTWTQQPLGRQPFEGRCGAALIADRRLLTSGQTALLGVVGGQLSYHPDSDGGCTAPIITSAETWYSAAGNLSHWTQGADAPFGARRSMQSDDAFVTADSADGSTAALSRVPLLHLDKTVSLTGGLRYLDHAWDAAMNRTQLTRAAVYADVWSCTLPTPEYQGQDAVAVFGCDWSHGSPLANLNRSVPAVASGSLPVPVADSASVPFPVGHQVWQLRVGGLSSAAGWRQWMARFVSSNVSEQSLGAAVLQQPVAVPGWPELRTATVEETRRALPISYELTAAELNSSDGSATVITHTLPAYAARVQAQYSTAHVQRSNMVQRQQDSSIHLYLATDATNTTRPLFDFSLQRAQHGQGHTWDSHILSAGIGPDGLTPSSDWITYTPQHCLNPMDPSYEALLGPGAITTGGGEYAHRVLEQMFATTVPGTLFYYQTPALYAPGDRVSWRCADGHRFQPWRGMESVELSCLANGLWMDAQLGSTRRCVPSRLHCLWPQWDDGGDDCADPEPHVTSIQLVNVHALRNVSTAQQSQPVQTTATTVTAVVRQFTSLNGDHQLFIYGDHFVAPVSVTVGGGECADAQLLRRQRAGCAESWQPACRYHSIIRCTLFPGPALRAAAAVVVRVGERPVRVIASTSPSSVQYAPLVYGTPVPGGVQHSSSTAYWARQPLTIATAAPRIVWVGSPTCDDSHRPADEPQLSLQGCANDARLTVVLLVANIDVGISPAPVPRVRFASDGEPGAFWQCTYASNIRDLDWIADDQVLADTAAPQPCDPQLPDFACRQVLFSIRCPSVAPQLGDGRIWLSWTTGGATSEDVRDNSLQVFSTRPASLTFAPCPAGFREQRAVFPQQMCAPCEPGFSTNGLTGQRSCSPCAPGSFSSSSGSAQCEPCPVGQHSASEGQSVCQPCPLNSYQRFPGQSECNACESSQYLRQPADSARMLCEACPASGVTCGRAASFGGNASVVWDRGEDVDSGSVILVARQSSYLLVDSSSGVVSNAPCAPLACVDGAQCVQPMGRGDSSKYWASIPRTGVAVINCCGDNREPAVDADGQLNVLCSACMDGYTEMQGRCVYCPAARWGRLLALLLLAFVLVCGLHRLSAGALRSTSAVLSIFVYFVQMSAVFMAGESLPLVISFLNLDLLGSNGVAAMGAGAEYVAPLSWCVAPLSGYGKVAMRLLSPLVAVGCLALLLCCQLLAGMAGARYAREAALHCWAAVSHHASGLSRLLSRRAAGQQWEDASQPWLAAERAHDEERGACETPATAAAASLSAPLLVNGAHAQPAAVATLSDVLVPYRLTLLRLALFSFNSLTATCLAFFHSQSVGEYGQRLVAYPSIEVGSPRYRLYQPFIVVVLVTTSLMGPVLLALYLRKLRRTRGDEAGQGDAVDASDSFVAPHSAGLRASAAAQALLVPFLPRYWWFSVYVLARRLLLVVMYTFLPAPSTFLVLTAVNIAVLYVQLELRPYRRQADNRLETATLAALVVQTMLLSANAVPELRPLWVTVLLWLLAPLLSIAIVIWQLVVSVRLYRTHRQQRTVAMHKQGSLHQLDL